MSNAPLEGLRILSLAEQFPGPYATMLLSDIGAEVIMVERPGMGDPARQFAPLFKALNRGKKSVTLDLKAAEGPARFREMAASADVIVEGFRPGKLAALGAGFKDLRKINPRLVYVSISGYGQDGPYRDRAGHDQRRVVALELVHLPQVRTHRDVVAGLEDDSIADGGEHLFHLGGGHVVFVLGATHADLRRLHVQLALRAFDANAHAGRPAEWGEIAMTHGNALVRGRAPSVADDQKLALNLGRHHFAFRSNNAMLSTCAVCGNMSIAPALVST